MSPLEGCITPRKVAETSTQLHGFEECHGDRNATEMLSTAIDEKSASLLVLLDMSKAFDSLNHSGAPREARARGWSPIAK